MRTKERWNFAAKPTSLLAAGLVLAPIAIGLVMKPEPLGSSSLGGSGTTSGRQFSAAVGVSDPTQRNVYQWAYEFESSPPGSLLGQPVDVIGFVYHRKQEASGAQFSVARFVVACCVADASGYTLPVQWPGGEDLRNDTWVHVQGKVATGSDGSLVIQAASVEPVGAPQNPYIYP